MTARSPATRRTGCSAWRRTCSAPATPRRARHPLLRLRPGPAVGQRRRDQPLCVRRWPRIDQRACSGRGHRRAVLRRRHPLAMLNVLFRSRRKRSRAHGDAGAGRDVQRCRRPKRSPAAGPTGTVDPAASIVQTNNLPASRNANPNIGVNQTVHIRDQLRSFVRTSRVRTRAKPSASCRTVKPPW